MPCWHGLEPCETQQEKPISTAVVGGGDKIGRRSEGRAVVRAGGGAGDPLQGGAREGSQKALARLLLRNLWVY